MDDRPIGVFDSGLGGISVLCALHRTLPGERLLYYGDSHYAPYGVLYQARIEERSLTCCQWLVDQGCKAVVIACNTASSAARDRLRATFSLPIVAMEPALRPALRHAAKNGDILVMATEATLRLARYHELVAELDAADRFTGVPCPDLVTAIEAGETGTAITQIIERALSPYRGMQVDAIVLGCTHFVLVRAAIQAVADGLFLQPSLVDGNLGTVRQLQRVLEAHGLQAQGTSPGDVAFATSGDAARILPQMRRLFAQGMSAMN